MPVKSFKPVGVSCGRAEGRVGEFGRASLLNLHAIAVDTIGADADTVGVVRCAGPLKVDLVGAGADGDGLRTGSGRRDMVEEAEAEVGDVWIVATACATPTGVPVSNGGVDGANGKVLIDVSVEEIITAAVDSAKDTSGARHAGVLRQYAQRSVNPLPKAEGDRPSVGSLGARSD